VVTPKKPNSRKRKMRIQIIVPLANSQFNEGVKKEAETVAAPDTEIDVVNLDVGPQSIESRYDEFLSTGDIIQKAQKAEAEGYHGIFVDCFGEPGVSVVRELVDIPVVGGFNPAVLTATLICQKFSIITVVNSVNSIIEDLARDLGITSNLASVRDVDIPVLELQDKEKLKQALIKQSLIAIDRDGAQAIVLGCTGMLDVAKEVERILVELGKPAPVIDPTTAAITSLQSLIRCQLSQSRLTYYKPAQKQGVGLLRTWQI